MQTHRLFIWIFIIFWLLPPWRGNSTEFQVYSIYKGFDLGEPNEKPQKDFYMNMGKIHGLQEGILVDVFRQIATYDVLSEKLYKDMLIPIAQLKVLHVENLTAIGRLEKLFPIEKVPTTTHRSVMVGDIVRIATP